MHKRQNGHYLGTNVRVDGTYNMFYAEKNVVQYPLSHYSNRKGDHLLRNFVKVVCSVRVFK